MGDEQNGGWLRSHVEAPKCDMFTRLCEEPSCASSSSSHLTHVGESSLVEWSGVRSDALAVQALSYLLNWKWADILVKVDRLRICERQEGACSVRFVSVLDFSTIHRFGSEMLVSQFDAFRPAFVGRVVARSGSVRFVSASGSGRSQN